MLLLRSQEWVDHHRDRPSGRCEVTTVVGVRRFSPERRDGTSKRLIVRAELVVVVGGENDGLQLVGDRTLTHHLGVLDVLTSRFGQQIAVVSVAPYLAFVGVWDE